MSDQSAAELAAFEELRKKCAARVPGLGEIARRLRDSGAPGELAEAAFLVGALDDISQYVDALLARCEAAEDYAARAAVGNIDRARMPLGDRYWLDSVARAEAAEAEAARLRETLDPLVVTANEIIEALSGDSWGYGYEHMGDAAREIVPFCRSFVAALAADTEPT